MARVIEFFPDTRQGTVAVILNLIPHPQMDSACSSKISVSKSREDYNLISGCAVSGEYHSANFCVCWTELV